MFQKDQQTNSLFIKHIYPPKRWYYVNLSSFYNRYVYAGYHDITLSYFNLKISNNINIFKYVLSTLH